MIALKKVIGLVITLIPSQVVSQCVNDDTFRFNYDGKDRTCRNIRIKESRRVDACTNDEVHAACPQACGLCCENISGYTFTRNNGMTGTCEWIVQNNAEARRTRYCDNTQKTFNGRTVRDGCPLACNFCKTYVSVVPSAAPSASATISPAPTETASAAPSGIPTATPTGMPSASPTSAPSIIPTAAPTRPPSPMPSPFPTLKPTSIPSETPSENPSASPSDVPSKDPSATPSGVPTKDPSAQPSKNPSASPSGAPSKDPSAVPSGVPTNQPSGKPSSSPSAEPSDIPSSDPSFKPSQVPTSEPSDSPSNGPTESIKPSATPSGAPFAPTPTPTASPTPGPTSTPSSSPSSSPSSCSNSATFMFELQNLPGEMRGCDWITKNNVATRQANYCLTGSDVLAECTQACGSCVADDPLYTFTLTNVETTVDCTWITKNLSKVSERLAYCDDESVAAGCAATCA